MNDICENLKSLDDPEAKSAMIWIIGEYVDSIENADVLLKTYIDTYALTIIIKIKIVSRKIHQLFNSKFLLHL